ncbi:MAG: flippase [Bacteroidota bacterium]
MTVTNEGWIRHLPPAIRERLHGRAQLQRILSNIVWLSLDKVLRLILTAVIGIWVTRYLGPVQFGLLNYAAAFVALFTPLATLGLDSIVIRDILGEDEEARRTSLGTAFAMRTAGAAVGAVCAFLLVTVVRPGDSLAATLVVLAGVGMFALAFDVIDLWFQSQVKAKFAVYAKNGAFLIMSGVRVILLVVGAPLVAFAWAVLAEALIGATALLIVYRRKGQHLRAWRVRLARASQFLRDSWPLAFATLGTILYMRIGQVMLGNILSDREVGEYSVAVRLAEAWYFLPVAITASVFPSVLSARRTDRVQYARRMQVLYGGLSVISIAVAIPTSFLARTVVVLLFGPQYADAGPALAVYVWASLPVFLGIASNQYLIAENRTRVALWRTVTGSVVNIILNMLLIPLWGILGAAVAALIAYSLATFSFAVVPDLRSHVLLMVRSVNPRFLYAEMRKAAGT